MAMYLLGDVLRIFAGDFTAGEIGGQPATPAMWMLAAIVVLVPIVMIVMTLSIRRRGFGQPGRTLCEPSGPIASTAGP